MKIIINILIASILFANNSFADNENNIKLFKLGNELYASGKYEKAVEKYENILKTGFESADLYFNMANAYYRIKKYTYSIYYYEKAKLLNPGNEDIIHNLDMTKLYIYDKITPLPELLIVKFTKNIINSKSVNFWAIFSIIVFVLSLISGLFYLFTKIRTVKLISFFAGLVLLLISITAFFFARQQNKYLNSHNTAIIFSPSISVKSSPDENATELFIIHEGLKVKIEDNSGNWYEIRLIDGKEGWVKKNDLKRI